MGNSLPTQPSTLCAASVPFFSVRPNAPFTCLILRTKAQLGLLEGVGGIRSYSSSPQDVVGSHAVLCPGSFLNVPVLHTRHFLSTEIEGCVASSYEQAGQVSVSIEKLVFEVDLLHFQGFA